MSKKSWYTKKNPLNRAKNKTTSRSVTPTKFWQNTSGKFLNLSRDISFFDPTMKIVFTLSILVVLASLLWKTLFTNVSSEASTIFALNNGAIFFFSWLLAREVDPDRPLGAYVSAALAVGTALIWGIGDIAVIFWLMMLMRLLNRSAGLGAGLFDNLIILTATYFVAYKGYWLYAALTAIAYALETQLPKGSPRSFYAAGFAFWIATLSQGIPLGDSSIPADIFSFMILATILFLPIVRMSTVLKSIGDYDKVILNTYRVQAAQIFFLATAFILTWFYGEKVLNSLLPVWSIACGTGLYLLSTVFTRKKS